MAGKIDVLVCGAGPVGLTAANELVRRGLRVRVVDQAAVRTDKSKALVLWSRTLELLDDAGYGKPFFPAGLECYGARISTGQTTIADVAFDSVESRYPFALMIPQSETERILEEQLALHGMSVERNTPLVSFTEAGGNVEAVLRRPDGVTESVVASWLVGCDGAHSTVRHGLGLAFEGSTEQSDWALADGHITGLPDTNRLHIYWHREGILAFFPIVGDRFRVVADLGPASGGGRRPDPTLDEINALLSLRGDPRIVMSDPIWLASFRINERKVKEYRKGRVFLAGDAAHIHSPAGGQGMNTGMQDAFNLSWKLAMVVTGAARETLLDSYSLERSAVGDMVLRNAGRMTEAATLRNPLWQTLRNTVAKFVLGFPHIQHKVADTLTELSISYPDSPLTDAHGHAGHAKAGDRWPHPIQSGTSFVAIGPSATTSALAARFPSLVIQGGSSDDGLLRLVRPDGYVGLSVTGTDVARAEAYLSSVAA